MRHADTLRSSANGIRTLAFAFRRDLDSGRMRAPGFFLGIRPGVTRSQIFGFGIRLGDVRFWIFCLGYAWDNLQSFLFEFLFSVFDFQQRVLSMGWRVGFSEYETCNYLSFCVVVLSKFCS